MMEDYMNAANAPTYFVPTAISAALLVIVLLLVFWLVDMEQKDRRREEMEDLVSDKACAKCGKTLGPEDDVYWNDLIERYGEPVAFCGALHRTQWLLTHEHKAKKKELKW